MASLSNVSVDPTLTASEERDMIDTRISVLHEEIRKLRTRRNTLAAVAKLPPELLSRIFTLRAWADESLWWPCYVAPRPRFPTWVTVTQVSQHWRAVALECSQLWFDVSFGYSLPWVKTIYERSRKAPIEVYIPSGASLTEDAQVCAVEAMSDTSRIRRLTVYCDAGKAIQGGVMALATPAPILEGLVLIHSDLGQLPEGFLGQSAPKLWFLTLSSAIPHSWTSPLLRSLTHLNISGSTASSTLDDILDALAGIPLLSSFRLSQDLLDTQVSRRRHQDVVCLTALQSLDLHMGSIRGSTCLLKHLSVPQTATVETYCTYGPELLQPAIKDFVAAYVSACLTTPSTVEGKAKTLQLKHARLRADRWSSVCFQGSLQTPDQPDRHQYTMEFRMQPDLILRALLASLSLASLETLEIESTGGPDSLEAEDLEPLRKLAHLKSLRFRGTGTDFFLEGIDALPTPSRMASYASYPSLKEVSFVGTSFYFSQRGLDPRLLV
ncbi:hypothetical protein BKA70DRAFT_1291198 [Coprinopsis sp. MPI-PUGE-AT-0042]|nr:hypothetical protein BKA70DRAFT_1291198 [Coprinopsis sp. MPI-PUGE-AT-0042]